jgi:6-pyruvoyltetrahydropterin/6-carboxytetrahydropterin synthase
MYTITKEFMFSASHQLNGLEKNHPCGRVHGHNYVVKVELTNSTVESKGMVQDYGELKPIKDWIDKTLDHRHLNEVMTGKNPTAENLAFYIYWEWKPRFPFLSAVEVSETPKTNARYEQGTDTSI